MAEVINRSPKLVFSKTLEKTEEGPHWKNITVAGEINPDEIIKLKEQKDYTILGSGSIIRQFANLNLIDEYELAVIPVILGFGKSFFSNVKRTSLELTGSKSFRNGIVLLNLRVKEESQRDSLSHASEVNEAGK